MFFRCCRSIRKNEIRKIEKNKKNNNTNNESRFAVTHGKWVEYLDGNYVILNIHEAHQRDDDDDVLYGATAVNYRHMRIIMRVGFFSSFLSGTPPLSRVPLLYFLPVEYISDVINILYYDDGDGVCRTLYSIFFYLSRPPPTLRGGNGVALVCTRITLPDPSLVPVARFRPFLRSSGGVVFVIYRRSPP